MGSRVTFSAHESDRLIGASETVGTNFVNGKTSLNTVYTPSRQAVVKFTFSEKATKIDKIFTINLTLCSNHQIDGEDFVAFLENMNFNYK